nr:hypothetical protein [Streptomyces sp. PR69]
MQQHARWRLVDVLGRRHQGRPGLLDGHGDLDVVDPIPCQPVDLVDEDVVDLVFCQILQHPLKVGTVSGLGRLPGVHELGDDNRTETFRLAAQRLTLRRDRESLGLATLLRLFFGRDAKIGNGRLRWVGTGCHCVVPVHAAPFSCSWLCLLWG